MRRRKSSRSKIIRKGKTVILEKTIARQNIVDSVATFLYSMSIVDDNQRITNIQFSDLFGQSTTEYCKLKIYIEEEGGAIIN